MQVIFIDDYLVSVALLAEGVDRNFSNSGEKTRKQYVALLAEGVDRNYYFYCPNRILWESPSSRRAWIEIEISGKQLKYENRRPPRGGRG